MTVAQDTVDSARASLRNAQALERGGLATLFDVLQAEVQLAQARQDLTQALNLQTIAQPATGTALKFRSPGECDGSGPLCDRGSLASVPGRNRGVEPTESSRIGAVFGQPADCPIQSAGGPWLPFDPKFRPLPMWRFADELDDNVLGAFGYSVGIMVSLNVFDGGAAKAAAAQEDENIAIAQTQFADTKNQLRFSVEQAYSTLLANFENIGTALRSVDRARENLRLAQLRFQAGIGTQLDITSAQADLTQSEGNLCGCGDHL